MTNHSWFINIKIIFDQSAVSRAFDHIEDYWIVSEQQLNIIFILIHGEPELIVRRLERSVYFAVKFWRGSNYLDRNLERAQLLKEQRITYYAYNIKGKQRFQLFLLAKSIQLGNYFGEKTYLAISTRVINYGEQIEPERERWSDADIIRRKL